MYCYSLFTHCSFDNNKSKHGFYRRQDSVKNFCGDLREHAAKIINCERGNTEKYINFLVSVKKKMKIGGQ